MEYSSSSEDLKDGSPSQEYIGHTHPMKLDVESVDDFEHITKEVSPSKEATAQFLQHETTYASTQNRDKGSFDTGDVSNFSKVIGDGDAQGSLPASTNDWAPESVLFTDNTDNLSSLTLPAVSKELIDPDFAEDDVGLSKNFMQYERTHDNKENVSPSIAKEMISDDDKLIDFESSTVFDDLPVKPGDFNSAYNSEILMQDSLSDTKNSAPTVPSQSLPGIMKNENEADVHSEKIPQGDGLHLRQTTGLDGSDTEEHVPEPLPKDYPEIGVIEPKDFLTAIGIDNWFRPERLNPKVESLIYWRDVKKSAIAFSCGFAVLLALTQYSLISVIAYTSLTLLGASVSLKVYHNVLHAVQKTPDTNPLKENLMKILVCRFVTEVFSTLHEFMAVNLALNHERIREFTETFVKNLNNAIIELRRRILVEDIVDSVKFAILLWAMTYIGAWFNGLSLIIMGYVALFTLPKVYENNKTQIDQNLDLVREKINLISDRIRAVIPLGKKEETKNKEE